jgi:hypothetical protein
VALSIENQAIRKWNVEESIIERCGLKQKSIWRNGKIAKWEMAKWKYTKNM